jgi:hypothetical protein
MKSTEFWVVDETLDCTPSYPYEISPTYTLNDFIVESIKASGALIDLLRISKNVKLVSLMPNAKEVSCSVWDTYRDLNFV